MVEDFARQMRGCGLRPGEALGKIRGEGLTSSSPSGTSTDMSHNGTMKERRERVGLTQQRLAELAGCSVGMIGKLDAGYRPGTSPVYDAVEQVLAQAERELEGAPQ